MNVANQNYPFQKRQREIAKQKKKEAKALRKLAKNATSAAQADESLPAVPSRTKADDTLGNHRG